MKVLITYASAGAGHRRAAEAVYKYLKLNRKEVELELKDILDFANPFFRFCYKRGYPFLVHYAVFLWDFFFFLTEASPTRWIGKKFAVFFNRIACQRFSDFLIRKNFDFIISTHFLNSELAANLKLKNKIASKLITVITDFGVHPFWLSAGTDLYIVASAGTKEKLLSLGVREESVKVGGIPTEPDFTQKQDRGKLAAKLGIDPEKFTVLAMTGSFGSGPLERIAESLSSIAQVMVVCANNKKLFTRLQKKKLGNVKVFGFIDNSQELMGVSDVIITKPGGLSIAELLNMGLLPIFISAIPGQEEENIKVLAAYGVGFAPEGIDKIKELVLGLKNDPGKLQGLRNNIFRLAKPRSCQEIADVIR